MLGEVVGQVGRAWSPVDIALLLFDYVLYPIKSHLHGLGFLLFDLFVGETVGGGVVDLDRGGGWGCPIPCRVLRNGAPSRKLSYSAPASASAADPITLRMTLDRLSKGPCAGSGDEEGLSPR
jgi:hypothetical protein